LNFSRSSKLVLRPTANRLRFFVNDKLVAISASENNLPFSSSCYHHLHQIKHVTDQEEERQISLFSIDKGEKEKEMKEIE